MFYFQQTPYHNPLIDWPVESTFVKTVKIHKTKKSKTKNQKMTDTKIQNLFLAITNLIALPTIIHTQHYLNKVIVIFAMVASILMHLSEKKHNLSGIHPFNRFAWLFLQIDRVVALISGLYVLYMVPAFTPKLLAIGIAGLSCMAISEHIAKEINWFVFWHTCWHICAFCAMYVVLV
jgi:uncharacterized membrane protein